MANSVASELTDMSEVNELLNDLETDTITSSVISKAWSKCNNNAKIGRCIITIFPTSDERKWLEPTTYFPDTTCINIWTGQFEICPTSKRLHAHLYIEFSNDKRPRFNTLRSIIEVSTGSPGNIQMPRKTSSHQRKCAVNYCLKPDGRKADSDIYVWPHNIVTVSYCAKLRATKKTKESTIQEIIDYLESKPKHWSWDQIVHESKESKLLLATCAWGPKYHQGRYAEVPRRTIQNVVVFYGAGGTGKTTMAQNFSVKDGESIHERYYKRNADDGKFWGGGRTAYKGQRIVHLEEFCGQETAANFKEICDTGKHGPSINIKNSGGELNHETVIITSNHHPAGWYRKLCDNDNKQWSPICRRFTQVWFFPEFRPDGTANMPDENTPPHYEDHTQAFKDLIPDYVAAVHHASNVWPLPQEASNDSVSWNKY